MGINPIMNVTTHKRPPIPVHPAIPDHGRDHGND